MPDSFKVDIDASYLRFDPNDTKLLPKLYKEIPAFEEFEHEKADNDRTKQRLFSWIIIMYDPNSPLRRELKDLYKRKVYAATLVGFNIRGDSGKYQPWMEDVFVGKDKAVNALVAKFISSFSSPEYTQLMAHVAIQEKMLEKIIAGKADKNTQIMFDTATDKIKELTNFIYGTGERDEVVEARRALYKQVAYDLSDMRPEQVARAVSSGEGLPDSWNPYGDNYLPEDIKFVGDDVEIAREDEESLP
jgi:hypothetical protein